MKDDARAFVIMQVGAAGSPVRKRADDVMKFVLTPVLAAPEYGLKVVRSDLGAAPGPILPSMLDDLLTAKLIIADLTGDSPNVFYELGIAHAFNRRVVSLGQAAGLPFDLHFERVIPLPPAGESLTASDAEIAQKSLKEALEIVLAENYAPRSPVAQFAEAASLDKLASKDPVAAELASLRDEVAQLHNTLAQSAQGQPPKIATNYGERPIDAMTVVWEGVMDRLRSDTGVTPAQHAATRLGTPLFISSTVFVVLTDTAHAPLLGRARAKINDALNTMFNWNIALEIQTVS